MPQCFKVAREEILKRRADNDTKERHDRNRQDRLLWL
jgi:hypothetical protein